MSGMKKMMWAAGLLGVVLLFVKMFMDAPALAAYFLGVILATGSLLIIWMGNNDLIGSEDDEEAYLN